MGLTVEFKGLVEGFHSGYERKGVFTLEEVFQNLSNDWAVIAGDVISITSLRYHAFNRSLSCVCCGITGVYFAKERSAKRIKKPQPDGPLFKATSENWHLNLYALDQNGREILMTKDHIVPKSHGGEDKLHNLQTMCKPCNGAKQNNRVYQARLPFWNAQNSKS